MNLDLENLARLTRDERAAAKTLGPAEARYLVDTYYAFQRFRITAGNQINAAEKQGEPHSTLAWAFSQFDLLEQQVKGALSKYVESHTIGQWAISQKGVGPVITAGFLSRLQIRPTVGHWWNFCGLNPDIEWKKGQVRPWNASLKRLCWLLGESFTKVSGRDDAFYGQLYRQRKEQEVRKNLAGDFAEQAAKQLASKNYGKQTEAYKAMIEGRLPDAQIHLRAQRYAVKFFLSHLHHVWHVVELNERPPKPFVIEHLGHAHYVEPPNFDTKEYLAINRDSN